MDRRAMLAIYWIAIFVSVYWLHQNTIVPLIKSSPWAGFPVYETIAELVLVVVLGFAVGWFYALFEQDQDPPEDDQFGDHYD